MKTIRRQNQRPYRAVGAAALPPPRCWRALGTLIPLVALILGAACSDASVVDQGVSADSVSSGAGDAAVAVVYLANEGFLLEGTGQSVLIDALFGEGLSGYPSVPYPLRDDLENGRGRFAEIDCVLATHVHADHFDAAVVAGFLERVPAQFLSSEAAAEEVSELLADDAAPAPRSEPPQRHEVKTVDCGGVEVSALSFHHGRLMVKNLAYLVDFDGLTVLHMGDTEITADEIGPWGLGNLGIDVALIPVWYLTEPSWLPVIDEIAARHVVAMHMASPEAPSSWFGSAGSFEERVADIRERFPEVWLPLEALDERRFGAGAH